MNERGIISVKWGWSTIKAASLLRRTSELGYLATCTTLECSARASHGVSIRATNSLEISRGSVVAAWMPNAVRMRLITHSAALSTVPRSLIAASASPTAFVSVTGSAFARDCAQRRFWIRQAAIDLRVSLTWSKSTEGGGR
jgi:hypothetical protein